MTGLTPHASAEAASPKADAIVGCSSKPSFVPLLASGSPLYPNLGAFSRCTRRRAGFEFSGAPYRRQRGLRHTGWASPRFIRVETGYN